MAKPHERIFALIAAVLFLSTSVAFSSVVIWQIYKDNKDSKQTAQAQKAVADVQKKTQGCSIGSVPSSVETVPETFKPDGPVSTLGTIDLKPGTGTASKAGDCLIVKYNGTLASDGTKFDGNFDKPTALRFQVGQGSVIKGWDQGMIGVKIGGVRRLVIPAALAYGAQSAGTVPPNSDLVFAVELIKIQQ